MKKHKISANYRLNPDLLKYARSISKEECISVTRLVEDGLRNEIENWLARRRMNINQKNNNQGDVINNVVDNLNPAIKQVLKYFDYKHLPEQLQIVSKKFHDLAHEIAVIGNNPEVTVSLRKLLEAKDAAVRSQL